MAVTDRRVRDRRVHKTSLHRPERRTGFDPRRPSPVLGFLRHNHGTLLVVLVVLNLLSLADWALTLAGFSVGATEANPVLAALMGRSVMLAGGFKFLVMLGVSVLVWRGRAFRAVLATLVFGVGLYLAVILYHFTGLAASGAI